MLRVVALLLAVASVSFAQSPTDVKVVVVTMFERGADTGDSRGSCSAGWNRIRSIASFPFRKAGATCG
jgi:hypothetical protein